MLAGTLETLGLECQADLDLEMFGRASPDPEGGAREVAHHPTRRGEHARSLPLHQLLADAMPVDSDEVDPPALLRAPHGGGHQGSRAGGGGRARAAPGAACRARTAGPQGLDEEDGRALGPLLLL